MHALPEERVAVARDIDVVATLVVNFIWLLERAATPVTREKKSKF
jgi:hypothetical protein